MPTPLSRLILSSLVAFGFANATTRAEEPTEPKEPAKVRVVLERNVNNVPAKPEAAGHHHGDKDGRFLTSRTSPVDLPLPEEDDAFFFVVFGDRTGGPAEGIKILDQAVTDTKLLDPDLVMTVGDLINGYNQPAEWMEQMKEYKGTMNRLDCPWFPVAGNHDVYWRGPNRPPGEHEKNYEMHFGPLWYAFEHKDCWFVVLYSDEGNPETGEKTFSKPEAQKVSPEQMKWLDETLKKTTDAKHVFVFLHHPRWQKGNYGNDWDRIHKRFVEAGNVRVVFAGHKHRMTYDGKRDGIEYVSLATVGGHQNGTVPEAGWLHHLDIVTVRDEKISISALPVGTVMDVRKITREVNEESALLARSQPMFDAAPLIVSEGRGNKLLRVTYSNPTSRPVDLTVTPDSADSRWTARPSHHHGRIAPGEKQTFEFAVSRDETQITPSFRPLELAAARDYLAEGIRIRLPEQRVTVPVRLKLPMPELAEGEERVLTVDGNDALAVPSASVALPDGPFTLEGWVKPKSFFKRTGVVTKTEGSEYGLFVIDNRPRFDVHLGGKYVAAIAEPGTLTVGEWQHIAGVYDGREVRLYIDGKQVAAVPGIGKRTPNGLPLIIGADVTSSGGAMSFFNGQIDGVRLSKTARYGEDFTPLRRPLSDDNTILLLNMDGKVGPFFLDGSPGYAHPVGYGNPVLTTVP